MGWTTVYSGTLAVNSSITIANISKYTEIVIQTNFGIFEAIKAESDIMCLFGYPTSNKTMYLGSLRLTISGTSIKYNYANAWVITETGISLYSGSVSILKIMAR